VRPITIIVSAAALLSAFLQEPFLHVHSALTDHPAASIAHLHARTPHASSSPTIGALTPDEDAIDIDWHIAAPPAFDIVFDLVAGEAIVAELVLSIVEPVCTPQPRAHDPPDFSPKSPRSPPV
jgi:hypothetical protein